MTQRGETIASFFEGCQTYLALK